MQKRDGGARPGGRGAGMMSEDPVIRPTAERQQHGRVRRMHEQLQDSDGAIGNPFKTVATLERMEANGTITATMRQAGERFRDDFTVAGLETLHAASMLRLPGGRGGDGMTGSQIDARRRLFAALDALGGPSSVCGSCAWYVLGAELTIKDFARRHHWTGRPVHQQTAGGLLLSVLSVLQGHYGLVKRAA